MGGCAFSSSFFFFPLFPFDNTTTGGRERDCAAKRVWFSLSSFVCGFLCVCVFGVGRAALGVDWLRRDSNRRPRLPRGKDAATSSFFVLSFLRRARSEGDVCVHRRAQRTRLTKMRPQIDPHTSPKKRKKKVSMIFLLRTTILYYCFSSLVRPVVRSEKEEERYKGRTRVQGEITACVQMQAVETLQKKGGKKGGAKGVGGQWTSCCMWRSARAAAERKALKSPTSRLAV